MNEFINAVLQTWMQIISSILWQWNDSNFYTKQTYNDTLEIRLSACMVEDTKIFIEDLDTQPWSVSSKLLGNIWRNILSRI